MQPKPISPRTLTASYCVALTIIAGLSILSHIVLDQHLRNDQGSAAIINISGRQRMLSQRISGLAAQYRLGDASARRDMSVAIAEFETAHDFLVAASRTPTDSDGSAQELQRLYFGTPDALDARMRSFIVDARRVVELSADDPALPAILARLFVASRSKLLVELEKIVTIQQVESERKLAVLMRLQWGILAVVLVTLLVEAMAIFRPMIRKITIFTSEILRLAATDSLTGAANRRSFMDKCTAELKSMRRSGRPATMLMIDVDRFKAINDTYGHAAGDDVLTAVGDVFRQILRTQDIWGRMGGEEFAVMLVETDMAVATQVAERIRRTLAETTVENAGRHIAFTVSVGVAAVSCKGDGIEDALRAADGLLYVAKNNGRNRVVGAVLADATI